MTDTEIKDKLASRPDFWTHWGFKPWQSERLRGVSRRQQFVKDGFLGTIADYGAWDYIVWDTGTEADRRNLWNSVRPISEIMTQRFLFLLPETWPGRRIKSFWLGFRGYLEFFAYWPPSGPADKDELPSDLTGLVDLILKPPKETAGAE